MRENRTSGLMRGGNGNGDSRPLLSTLLVWSFLAAAEGRAEFGLANPGGKVTMKVLKCVITGAEIAERRNWRMVYAES
jgi:hypothetical protein